MGMTGDVLDDSELEFRKVAWRARKALEEAPELAQYVRALVVESGSAEAGETLREWNAPMRITTADAVDEMFAELVEWVVTWAERFGEAVPDVTRVAWRNGHDERAYGFRAGTTSTVAFLHVRMQTLWLLDRHEAIEAWHDRVQASTYFDVVTSTIWELRAAYPMAMVAKRGASSVRACELCLGDTVEVRWFVEDDRAQVAVICGLCGWMPAERDVRTAMQWIEVPDEGVPNHQNGDQS